MTAQQNTAETQEGCKTQRTPEHRAHAAPRSGGLKLTCVTLVDLVWSQRQREHLGQRAWVPGRGAVQGRCLLGQELGKVFCVWPTLETCTWHYFRGYCIQAGQGQVTGQPPMRGLWPRQRARAE